MSESDYFKYIEKKIGRKLRPEDRGSIKSLNDISDQLLQEARKIESPLDIIRYIDFYVNSDSHKFVMPFVEQVVEKGMDAATWAKGEVLIPDWSLEDQLTLPREVLLKPLGGSFTQCVTPEFKNWKTALISVGAPAKVTPDANYLTRARVKNASSLSLRECQPIESIPVAMRRWHAARMSSILSRKKDLKQVHSIDDLQDLISTPFEQWSDDAKIAARALIREINTPELQDSNQVFGFKGPREWYEEEP